MFGTLDQTPSPPAVKVHTGMYLPWTQAKLTLYYLFLHIQFHEATHGRVEVPDRVKPERPWEAMAHLADLPNGQLVVERATQAWNVLFGATDEET